MQTALPLGIASLVAGLKKAGIQSKVFDTVLYQLEHEVDENKARAESHHSTKPLDYNAVGISVKETDMLDDFRRIIFEYEPDLIALTAVESTFERGIQLTRLAKTITTAHVIAGGVFPTLAPDIVLAELSIDMVCVGEGEELLVELCRALHEGRKYSTIAGLWLKHGGEIIKNPGGLLKSLDEELPPDFTAFAPYMFYKAMQGNLFKTIPVEMSRGCPYQCSYCAEPALKRLYKHGRQDYFRKKSIDCLFNELEKTVDTYSPEFIYFATETFLAMSEDEFQQFVDGYRNFRIPFWIQTRPETISLDKIQRLKEVGLFWLTIGIECGNEEYRSRHLKRTMRNETIVQAVKILAECNQGASLNSIIGFPHETRALMFETIMLNRSLFQLNNRIRVNISMFTPFRGCELYDVCIRDSLMESVAYISDTNINHASRLKFESVSPDELAGIYRTIPLYIYLPDEYLERIKEAEKFTDTGNRNYAELNRQVGHFLD